MRLKYLDNLAEAPVCQSLSPGGSWGEREDANATLVLLQRRAEGTLT